MSGREPNGSKRSRIRPSNATAKSFCAALSKKPLRRARSRGCHAANVHHRMGNRPSCCPVGGRSFKNEPRRPFCSHTSPTSPTTKKKSSWPPRFFWSDYSSKYSYKYMVWMKTSVEEANQQPLEEEERRARKSKPFCASVLGPSERLTKSQIELICLQGDEREPISEVGEVQACAKAKSGRALNAGKSRCVVCHTDQ